MSEQTVDKDFGPFSEPLRSVLLAQTRMLDSIIHIVAGGSEFRLPELDSDVSRVTSPMLQAMGVSMHSIIGLTKNRDMSIRDTFGMARSIVELAVNSCYILACGGDIARRAARHAMQKTYRDFSRRGELGGTLIEVKRVSIPEIDAIPGLRAALDEFTDKKGREVRNWTPLDMSARISHVKELHDAAAIALSGATMSIYRHSSEMLHGTYFSTVFFWMGSSAFGGDKIDFNERWNEHFTSIFTSCYFAAQGVIEIFGSRYALPDLVKIQHALNREVLTLIERFGVGSVSAASTVQRA